MKTAILLLVCLVGGCAAGPSQTALKVASEPCPCCGGRVGTVQVFDARELIGEGWQCLDCRERLD